MLIEGADVSQVLQAQTNWEEAIESLDIERVLALYHPDHPCLWGTVAGVRRDTIDHIRNYFEHFLAKEIMVVTFDQPHVRVFGDIAINSGYYSFDWEVDGGKQFVEARYSFTYQRVGDEWLIVDHHSSAMPPNGI